MNEQKLKIAENIDLSKIDKQTESNDDKKNIDIINSSMKTDNDVKDLLDKPNVQNSLREKNKRCSLDGCNKKLRLTDMSCKCGFRFCGAHRVWSDHKCTYDYKKNERVILEKNNERVVGDKVSGRIH